MIGIDCFTRSVGVSDLVTALVLLSLISVIVNFHCGMGELVLTAHADEGES